MKKRLTVSALVWAAAAVFAASPAGGALRAEGRTAAQAGGPQSQNQSRPPSQRRADAGGRRASAPTAETEAAVTLEDYRTRLGRAARALEELAAFCEMLDRAEDPSVWSGGEFDPDVALELPAREENAMTAARRLLHPSEKVAAGGQTYAADNRWLFEALAAYERQSPRLDNEKRAEALGAAAGRLRSLEAALGGGASAPARDKDAEKGRLNNILRRPEFDKETAKGGALQRLVEDAVKWLRGLLPEFGPLRPGAGEGASRGAQFLVFGVCLLLLAYLGWRLVQARRLRGPKAARRGARVVLGERLEEDQTAADLLAEAERLARAGDARAAIRKAYVALLVELGDRGVLRLAQHKTNRDYLRAAREAAPPRVYDELLPLTFDFELHWYGHRPAAEGEWQRFRDRCRRVLASA
ncbi:MAG TPA: DUF4129 domain-containing protein [Pyrinomonadaceae bacterium]|nr:DUF4129 domain-containing protein [Pyrinomonadaceae bacterium]